MILIIDDDSAVRSSLSFMLKRAGYEAQTVSGPREAMEVVRSVAPDLILMDMNFTLSTTGEEGLTLLRQVKIFRPETPVILMTAWGSIQLAVQGMQAGAFDFITKPWNNAALLQRIETALELAGSPKETTQEQNDAFDRRHIIGRSTEHHCPYSKDECFRTDHRRKWDGQGTDSRGDTHQQPACQTAFCQSELGRNLPKSVRK